MTFLLLVQEANKAGYYTITALKKKKKNRLTDKLITYKQDIHDHALKSKIKTLHIALYTA